MSPRPGTDGALALGLIRQIIHLNFHDSQYVQNHVNGFRELIESCESYTPQKVAEICRLPEAQVKDLAARCGNSRASIVWMGGSLSRYTNSIQTVRAVIALQAITGNLSGPGKGIMNVQGGKPGGGEAFDEAFSAPGLASPLHFRKTVYNMERGRLKLLLLNSSYRRYSDADRIREAIRKVDFVVYRGFFMDDEAQLAHLIIPATMTFESAGAQYGNQRQVVWREQAIPRPGETVEDWRFYRDLGRKILPGQLPALEKEEDIYELFRTHAPTWAGLTLDRLKKDPSGISWPCPSIDHPGTRGTLYPGDKFLTPSGKAELYSNVLGPINWAEPEGSPVGSADLSKDFPLILIQGKVIHHWQHTLTNWSSYIAQFSNGNYIQVHPETARKQNISDGDWVYLETKRGKMKARTSVTELIMPGIVWTPSHPAPRAPYERNAGATLNAIIPPAWDLIGAQYNGFACRLIKV